MVPLNFHTAMNVYYGMLSAVHQQALPLLDEGGTVALIGHIISSRFTSGFELNCANICKHSRARSDIDPGRS